MWRIWGGDMKTESAKMKCGNTSTNGIMRIMNAFCVSNRNRFVFQFIAMPYLKVKVNSPLSISLGAYWVWSGISDMGSPISSLGHIPVRRAVY